jgi:hypothetical protein
MIAAGAPIVVVGAPTLVGGAFVAIVHGVTPDVVAGAIVIGTFVTVVRSL